MLFLLSASAASVVSFGSAQDLPDCVYDAFPDLNKTLHLGSPTGERTQGLTCDLCVTLLTDIEEILQDQTIEDAVSDYLCSIEKVNTLIAIE